MRHLYTGNFDLDILQIHACDPFMHLPIKVFLSLFVKGFCIYIYMYVYIYIYICIHTMYFNLLLKYGEMVVICETVNEYFSS